ncbi:MAG: hypothetical protein R3F21_05400 [Myxococcota bacterium]
MWTLGWAIATIVLFTIAIVPTNASTGGDFHALFLVLAMTTAGIFGFSLFITLGRWLQERNRKGSQPMRDSSAQENPFGRSG